MVFITQLSSRLEHGSWVPSVDVTPAREFGELHFMIPAGVNFPEARMAEAQLWAQLDVAPGFRNVQDFLLPMGDPVVMAAAIARLGARREPFRILKWDRFEKRYVAFTITPS